MILEAIAQLELSKVRRSVFILTCLLPILTCQARTITVDGDGPADFRTIQAAIDDANHRDIIVVKPGIYIGDGNHDVHFGSKAITVRAESGPNVTVIDCENNDYGFGIRDNDVSEARLEGFSIRNAAYGAIKCYSSILPRSPTASQGSQMNVAILYNPDYADVVIANCVITANQSIGVVCDGHDNVTITNCDILQNGAEGIYSYMSWPTIKNCLVAENGKAGIRATGPTIVNCTIVANEFDGVRARDPNVTNTIIWANSHEQIRDLNGNSVVTYSDVQGGWKGRGNIDSDPLFADPDSGDYCLLRRSPCIDAGDPNYIPQPNETDRDGKARITNCVIDMGAYEWHGPRILYVDADADGANDGSSWTDAYNFLQDALAEARSSAKPLEIRVAQGVHRPDKGQEQTLGDRQATFQLINGVTIKAGFAGFSEPDPNARDISAYDTILSGDLAGNDIDVDDPCDLAGEATRAENSFHVVTGSRTNSRAMLDGFVITGGNANRKGFQNLNRLGAGMLIDSGSPRLTDCTIRENYAQWYGAGMSNSRINHNPTLTNCTFSRNYAGRSGGAIANNSSSPMVANCKFIGNLAGWYGGAMSDSQAGSVLSGCIFRGNSAEYGGAIYDGKGSTSLTNCAFTGNSAKSGGGIFTGDTSFITLRNCTFAGNWGLRGNAVACNGVGSWGPAWSEVELTNCILWDGGEEMWINDNSRVVVAYSDVQGGQAEVNDPRNGLVWAPSNIETDPLFADSNNGDYHLKSRAGRWEPATQTWIMDDVTSPCIDAGDPSTPIGNEPFPNGGIVNIGAYGGTAEASKSYFGEPVCETIVAGDVNGDCKIDFLDFAIMSYHWLEDHRKR